MNWNNKKEFFWGFFSSLLSVQQTVWNWNNKKFIHNKFIFVYTLSTQESGLNCCKNYFYNSQQLSWDEEKKMRDEKVLESHKNRLNFIQQSLHRKVMIFEEKKNIALRLKKTKNFLNLNSFPETNDSIFFSTAQCDYK